MAIHTAEARWTGTLQDGKGTIESQSGALKAGYDWKARAGESAGTNPEELIAAAHAGCFSMAFAAALGKGGFPPQSIHTKAAVTFEKVGEGFGITKIDLVTEASVPNIAEDVFQKTANGAKENCPVSKLFAGGSAKITLNAKLQQK